MLVFADGRKTENQRKTHESTGENQIQLYSNVVTHPRTNPFELGLTLDKCEMQRANHTCHPPVLPKKANKYSVLRQQHWQSHFWKSS